MPGVGSCIPLDAEDTQIVEARSGQAFTFTEWPRTRVHGRTFQLSGYITGADVIPISQMLGSRELA